MTTDVTEPNLNRSSGGVQSLDRAFSILEAMADAGGSSASPSSPRRRPAAGHHPPAGAHPGRPRLRAPGGVAAVLPGAAADAPVRHRLQEGRTWTRPAMNDAVARLGESVNLATLDGDEIVYVAQVQPSATSCGCSPRWAVVRRPHATAVGKAILADLPDAEVVALLERTGMPRTRRATLTTPQEFWRAPRHDSRLRARRGEQEVGVRCVAVRVPDAPQPMAMSMSGPLARVSDEVVEEAARVLTETAAEIGSVLSGTDA